MCLIKISGEVNSRYFEAKQSSFDSLIYLFIFYTIKYILHSFFIRAFKEYSQNKLFTNFITQNFTLFTLTVIEVNANPPLTKVNSISEKS